MFLDHPIFGVGIDRFGAYFKEYIDVDYWARFGSGRTSSNAHNVIIQTFATGGLLVGIAYLSLLGFIFWRALIALKIADAANKIHVTIIFASWIAYQAQSMVSIDNLGIAVWGWLLGGILVGLSFTDDIKLVSVQKYFSTSRTARSPKLAFLFSTPILISVSFLVAFLYRGEGLFYEQKKILASQNTSNNLEFREIALSTLETPLLDPRYKFQTSVSLVNNGFVEDGLSGLISQQKNDPRDLLTLNALAEVYDQIGREELAIEYRLKIGQLDPNDVKNFRSLSKLLKLTNQREEAKKYRIISANLAALRK